MSLKLYMHPLSSYCHKALIAFYENEISFDVMRVDEPTVQTEFRKIWPIGRFPVLRDESRDRVVPESTTIIEYLAQHYPGKVSLVPDDLDLARQVRMRDRFFDNYVHTPMQTITAEKLRPANSKDPYGENRARELLTVALDMLDREMETKRWSMGDAFTMADCSAAPALFYNNLHHTFEQTHPHVFAYLQRLMARPAYARVLQEAQPYLHLFPR